MRKTRLLLAVLAMTGIAGCVTPNEAGLCLGLRPDVARLRTALLANPQTPDTVGQAGTDVVIGFRGGCP
jgi:hypothetical protein